MAAKAETAQMIRLLPNIFDMPSDFVEEAVVGYVDRCPEMIGVGYMPVVSSGYGCMDGRMVSAQKIYLSRALKAKGMFRQRKKEGMSQRFQVTGERWKAID